MPATLWSTSYGDILTNTFPWNNCFNHSSISIESQHRTMPKTIFISIDKLNTWWRHQIETYSALVALSGQFTSHRWIPLTKANDAELWCFLRLNTLLGQQSWGWWFETPSRSLWRHCNEEHTAYFSSYHGQSGSHSQRYKCWYPPIKLLYIKAGSFILTNQVHNSSLLTICQKQRSLI